MLKFGKLRLSVIAPKGWTVQPAQGWNQDRRATRTEVLMDSMRVLKLQLRR
jgi:hypothetical protein